MAFLDYEKNENLFVQALKGSALVSTLRNIATERWTVLVPQSVSLEELGIGVVTPEFLKTHTVLFDDASDACSFSTLNGLKGRYNNASGTEAGGGDTEACDSITISIPGEVLVNSTPTPLGPAAADSPLTDTEATTQTIQILRQTELLIDTTDNFTISIHLVSDAVRAKWLTGDSVESIGWFGESTQQPRQTNPMPLKPVAGSATPSPTPSGGVQKSPKKEKEKEKEKEKVVDPPHTAVQRPKQFRFRDFAEKMRGAKELHAELRSFVAKVNASSEISDEALPGAVRDFLANMYEEIKLSTVWKGASEQELDFAQEGVEKYTLTKIFSRTFSTAEDKVMYVKGVEGGRGGGRRVAVNDA